MSIKHHESPAGDAATPHLADAWSGSWGSIAPSNQVVGAIRFRKIGEESYSYPYHVIIRWHWKDGETEELEIKAAGDVITILGRGLEKLVDALDNGRLQQVFEQGSERRMEDNIKKVQIYSITIEESS